MSAKWRYLDINGQRLAELSLDSAPPIGWPVMMVGPDPGPVRHYEVIEVNEGAKTLVLRRNEP